MEKWPLRCEILFGSLSWTDMYSIKVRLSVIWFWKEFSHFMFLVSSRWVAVDCLILAWSFICMVCTLGPPVTVEWINFLYLEVKSRRVPVITRQLTVELCVSSQRSVVRPHLWWAFNKSSKSQNFLISTASYHPHVTSTIRTPRTFFIYWRCFWSHSIRYVLKRIQVLSKSSSNHGRNTDLHGLPFMLPSGNFQKGMEEWDCEVLYQLWLHNARLDSVCAVCQHGYGPAHVDWASWLSWRTFRLLYWA